MARESDHSKTPFRRIHAGDRTDSLLSPGGATPPSWPSTFDLDDALCWPFVSTTTSPPEEELARPVPSAPTPGDLVSSMPTVTGGGVCAVCMEEVGGAASGKMMPCSHVYHRGCILEWLARHGSCPLCRCRIRPE